MTKFEKYFNSDYSVVSNVMDCVTGDDYAQSQDYFYNIHKDLITKHYDGADWDWDEAIELWSEEDIESAIHEAFIYALENGYEDEYWFDKVNISWDESQELWYGTDTESGETDCSDKVKRLVYMVSFDSQKNWLTEYYS